MTHSVNQAVASGETTFLAFDTRLVNVGGVWLATANTRLTAPVSGWYDLAACVEFAAGGGTFRSLAFRVNGATYVGLASVPPSAAPRVTILALSSPVELAAGDYAELRAGQDSGAPLNADAAASFSPSFGMIWRCPRAT